MARIAMATGRLLSGLGVMPLHGAWRGFCRALVRVFYRSCEFDGLEHLPRRGPVILCANHPNALIDAVIIQAASPRIVHPLARSGLFRNPLLRPFLAAMQAVPVHRRQDSGVDPSRNVAMFERCFQMLAAGGALLIFPEGESHPDPAMRRLKTGAARLALGALERGGAIPVLIPVGLNFTDVGRFRSKVYVKFHPPLALGWDVKNAPGESAPEEAVLRLTESIDAALRRVTLNPESWADLELMRRLERFFWLRRGKYRRRSLRQRFRVLQKFSQALERLRHQHPGRIEAVSHNLHLFEGLCRRFGVHDYHLTVRNSPWLVIRFVSRSLLVVVLALPLAAWGMLNSGLPYLFTGMWAVRLASDRYRYDTATAALGMGFFTLFWGGQTAVVYILLDGWSALAYLFSLPPTAALALYVRRERERIWDNMRVFFLFLRNKEVRRMLEVKRTELERELARLGQLAK